jgi:hypothetical protein
VRRIQMEITMKRIPVVIAVVLCIALSARAEDQARQGPCTDIVIGHTGVMDAKTAIHDAGEVFMTPEYGPADDAMLENIAFQYFDSGWRGDFIAGFGVYAMVRAALAHRFSPDMSTETKLHIGCVLGDVRRNTDDALRLKCQGLRDSCAEEYIARALAFAAHDAWFGGDSQTGMVHAYATAAFQISPFTQSPYRYSFMRNAEGEVLLFNHDTENPVYAMLTIMHLHHIRRIYEAAGMVPPDFGYLKPNVEEVLAWLRTKVGLVTYDFIDSGCDHYQAIGQGSCNCQDRVELTCNPSGAERHPSHYPLRTILNHLGVSTSDQWPWSQTDFQTLECSQSHQEDHNYIFNCMFSRVLPSEVPIWSY